MSYDDVSTYNYELSDVTDSIRSLKSQLPHDASLLYSLKANPHPYVVEHAARQNVGLEVSSEGELDIAARARSTLDHPVEIVCTGPGKTERYLGTAATENAVISIESATELTSMRRLGLTGQSILVRINAASTSQRSGLQMTGAASPFGIDEEHADDVVRRVIDEGHNFRGVHLYMGSNIALEDDLVSQFDISTTIAHQYAKYAKYASGRFIADLGGGFGHPFAEPGDTPIWPGLRERVESLTEKLQNSRTDVTFESGRYIAGKCGSLTATVLDVKESKGERYVVLSSGVNHLGGLAGLRRLPQARFGTTSPSTGSQFQPERIVGPLCTPVDILNKRSATTLSVGDTVTIPNVGAYGLSASLSNFLSHPYPVEEIRLDGKLVTATRTQLVTQEVVPA